MTQRPPRTARPPEHLDYGTLPPPRPRDYFSFTASFAVGQLCGLLLLVALITDFTFRPLFTKMGTTLPALTTAVLAYATWTRQWGWVILLSLPIIAGFAIPALGLCRPRNLNEIPTSPRQRARFLFLIVTLLSALIVLAVVLALFLPMLNMIQSVAK